MNHLATAPKGEGDPAPCRSQGCEPRQRQGYTPWPNALDTFELPTTGDKTRRLTPAEQTAVRRLLSHVPKGATDVRLRQDTLGNEVDVTARHIRRLLGPLRRAGLIDWTLARHKFTKCVMHTVFDLAPILALLPEATQKARGIYERIRAKMSGRSEPQQSKQAALDFDTVHEENAPEIAENPDEQSAENPDTYRTSTPDITLTIQPLVVEQQSSNDPSATPLRGYKSDSHVVVAALVAEKVAYARAWSCVKAKGPEVCREFLASFRFEKNVKDPGKWLSSAILKGYDLHPAYLAMKTRDARRKQADERAAADQAARRSDIEAERLRRAEAEARLDTLSGDDFAALLEETRARLPQKATPQGQVLHSYCPGNHLNVPKRALLRVALLETLALREKRKETKTDDSALDRGN